MQPETKPHFVAPSGSSRSNTGARTAWWFTQLETCPELVVQGYEAGLSLVHTNEGIDIMKLMSLIEII